MKWHFIIGIIIVLLVVIGGCMQQGEPDQVGYIDVTPAEAKDLIDSKPDLVIIDVSPPLYGRTSTWGSTLLFG